MSCFWVTPRYKQRPRLTSAGSPLPTVLPSTTHAFGYCARGVSPAAARAASLFARKTLASALWLNR